MIPEFLVILTNCISDYWVVSPPKKRSKSPSNPPIRPPKQTWPSSMGFQAPKVLKVTGYHRLQYLNSMTQCGILPIHQASKDDLSITQTTYINGISIFISYNIVHPDMWHNQLYSIHIHIYIYISQYVILLSTISHFCLGFPSRPAPVSLCNWLLISTSQDGKVTGRKWITNAEQKWPRQWTPWFPALWGRPCKVAAKKI